MATLTGGGGPALTQVMTEGAGMSPVADAGKLIGAGVRVRVGISVVGRNTMGGTGGFAVVRADSGAGLPGDALDAVDEVDGCSLLVADGAGAGAGMVVGAGVVSPESV